MPMTVEWAVIVAVLAAGFFVFAYGLGFMAGVRDEQDATRRERNAQRKELLDNRRLIADLTVALQEAKEDGWITVEDCLPEGCNPVIIHSDKHWVYVGRYWGASGWEAGGEVTVVTHWRLLPEPPKE
jgi:hypothetical protein